MRDLWRGITGVLVVSWRVSPGRLLISAFLMLLGNVSAPLIAVIVQFAMCGTRERMTAGACAFGVEYLRLHRSRKFVAPKDLKVFLEDRCQAVVVGCERVLLPEDPGFAGKNAMEL